MKICFSVNFNRLKDCGGLINDITIGALLCGGTNGAPDHDGGRDSWMAVSSEVIAWREFSAVISI